MESSRVIREDLATEIYAIGIRNADMSELVNVASQPGSKYLKQVDDFGDLTSVANEWVLDFCPEVNCSKSNK